MKGWPHPSKPLAPVAVAVAILATWWLVAHNSGAGWVQVLGDMVLGILVVGIAGPAVVLARVRVNVVSSPSDTTAGLPSDVRLEASTRLMARPVEPSGPETFVGPGRDHQEGAVAVTLIPSRRGVHEHLVVDISTAAPFALQWWTRRVRLLLPSAIYVAPRMGPAERVALDGYEPAGDSDHRVPAREGEPRGARPYRSEDGRRLVHWRATAHTGELMVREAEGRSAQPVTLSVALPQDPEAADRTAERALGTIVGLLDRGVPLVLATDEGSGPVRASVVDRRGAGRRLAVAVSRPSAEPGPAPAQVRAVGISP